MVPNEAKNYVRGLYGKPTIPISDKIRNKIIGDEDVFTGRPADLLEDQLYKYKDEIKEYIEQDEDNLTYALFPQVALGYFKLRQAKKYGLDSNLIDNENRVYPA